MEYKLVAPENYTAAQKMFVDDFKESIVSISKKDNIIMGAKDIYSQHLISTDAYAKIVGLNQGLEVMGRFDRDMPCEGTAQFAETYVQEDRALMMSKDFYKTSSILNVHEYSDGLAARVFCKQLMRHDYSHSILGTIYYSHEVNLPKLMTILHDYILLFGMGCSIEEIDKPFEINNGVLTEFEQEVCFFLLLKWDFKKIVHYISAEDHTDPLKIDESIIVHLCEKLGLSSNSISDLRETLMYAGVHKKMTPRIFKRLIGSWTLGQLEKPHFHRETRRE